MAQGAQMHRQHVRLAKKECRYVCSLLVDGPRRSPAALVQWPLAGACLFGFLLDFRGNVTLTPARRTSGDVAPFDGGGTGRRGCRFGGLVEECAANQVLHGEEQRQGGTLMDWCWLGLRFGEEELSLSAIVSW